jgi:hypothetical protein
MNIFATEAQAIGSRALAKLSQQLADFNGEWEPKWGEGTGSKYCIHSRFCGKKHIFVVDPSIYYLSPPNLKSVHPSLQI